MVETFLVLIGLQLLGEWLARWLHIPVPGPVLGMLLLFVGLCLRRGVPTALQHGVPAFLQHLSLLFVPVVYSLVAARTDDSEPDPDLMEPSVGLASAQAAVLEAQ